MQNDSRVDESRETLPAPAVLIEAITCLNQASWRPVECGGDRGLDSFAGRRDRKYRPVGCR